MKTTTRKTGRKIERPTGIPQTITLAEFMTNLLRRRDGDHRNPSADPTPVSPTSREATRLEA